MCDNNNTQSIADYLAQLLKDKKQLAAFPNVFLHLERLLDDGKKIFLFTFDWGENRGIKSESEVVCRDLTAVERPIFERFWGLKGLKVKILNF